MVIHGALKPGALIEEAAEMFQIFEARLNMEIQAVRLAAERATPEALTAQRDLLDEAQSGIALDNPVLRTEGRVTMIDALLALTVMIGLILNSWFGWWWADPLAGYVLVFYAAREVRTILRETKGAAGVD